MSRPATKIRRTRLTAAASAVSKARSKWRALAICSVMLLLTFAERSLCVLLTDRVLQRRRNHFTSNGMTSKPTYSRAEIKQREEQLTKCFQACDFVSGTIKCCDAQLAHSGLGGAQAELLRAFPSYASLMICSLCYRLRCPPLARTTMDSSIPPSWRSWLAASTRRRTWTRKSRSSLESWTRTRSGAHTEHSTHRKRWTRVHSQ